MPSSPTRIVQKANRNELDVRIKFHFLVKKSSKELVTVVSVSLFYIFVSDKSFDSFNVKYFIFSIGGHRFLKCTELNN